MLEYITKRYGQRDQANRLFYELVGLKQGEKETFSSYYTKFQKCRTRIYLIPESEKQLLEGSLNYRYSNRLVDSTVYTILKELTDRLYNIKDGFARLEVNKPLLYTDNSRGANRGRGNRYSRGQRRGRGGFNSSYNSGNSGSSSSGNNSLLLYTNLPKKYRNLKALSNNKRFKLIYSGYYLRYYEHGYYGRNLAYIFKKYQMLLRANAIGTNSTNGSSSNYSIQRNSETST